jgi:hypothetical protein
MAFAPLPRRDPLALSASLLCARPEPLALESSLRRTGERLSEEGLPALLVWSEGVCVGLIGQMEITEALANGASANDPVGAWMRDAEPSLDGSASGSEALRLLHHSGEAFVVVKDAIGQPMGILTPSRLVHENEDSPRPRMVGGMATPLGVYLTNGQTGAGANWVGLVLTGAVMFFFFLVGAFAMVAIGTAVPANVHLQPWYPAVEQLGALAIFMLGIRVSPIAGIHGAEHMVVHAIERGEELRPEIVRRMPRIHPRCGTNLAAGMMIFLGVLGWEDIRSMEIRVLTAIIVTLIAWRPVGTLMQQFVTTTNPNDAQLASGIRAGQELISKSHDSGWTPPNPVQRIFSSGVLQIIAGASILHLLVWLIVQGLRLPEAWRVI